MKYTIDYNTGITEEFEGTLAEAKAKADGNVNYTQQNIDIIDENDAVVATRKWWVWNTMKIMKICMKKTL